MHVREDINKLSPECKEIAKQYMLVNSKSEEETLKWAVKMRLNDPGIYKTLKPVFAGIVQKFEGSKEAVEFWNMYVLEFFQ